MEMMEHQKKVQETVHEKPNLTGIPTQMKQEFEARSGLSFDDVRVHYSSDKPAQLKALAYTQGSQVYVGPGQEKHLRHELGHVVQQKLGRIPVTRRVNGVPVNDDPRLEAQADRIGVRGLYVPAGGCQGDTVQRYTPKEEKFIAEYYDQLQKRLQKYSITLSKDECEAALSQLYHGVTPWLGNSHRILTRRRLGLYLRKKIPASDGGHMRTSKEGTRCYLDVREYDGLPSRGPYAGCSCLGPVPRARGRRKSLKSVMGGKSAAARTGIRGAEYLHIVAHQLGGKDAEENLVPGLHALNTAMIPVENAASDLSNAGYQLEYRVMMIPGGGGNYMNAVEITITVRNKARRARSYAFMLSLSDSSTNMADYMLNDEDYVDIQKQVEEWAHEIQRFCKRIVF